MQIAGGKNRRPGAKADLLEMERQRVILARLTERLAHLTAANSDRRQRFGGQMRAALFGGMWLVSIVACGDCILYPYTVAVRRRDARRSI
jgi:hypothetical protein